MVSLTVHSGRRNLYSLPIGLAELCDVYRYPLNSRGVVVVVVVDVDDVDVEVDDVVTYAPPICVRRSRRWDST
jgi:hypothetical protein